MLAVVRMAILSLFVSQLNYEFLQSELGFITGTLS